MSRLLKSQPRRPLIELFAGLILLLTCASLGFSQANKRTAAPVEIPFEFEHNQVIVQVKIAGKGPFNMLLDTNTDPSAIDTAAARDLGLAVGSKGSPATGGGTQTNTIYSTVLQNVEVGGIVARELAAATIDLTKLAEKLGRPIQGVLGYSFLKDRIVQIDYPN